MIGQEAIGAAPVQAAGRADVPGGDAGSTITRRTLENGTTAIVRENRAAPVVALTLLVEGGSAAETRGTSGVTALLGRVLLKGTRRRSALDIAQTAEDAGGTIESASDQEYAEITTHGLARHWPALLALVHEVVTEPLVAPETVEREREVLLAQIRGLEDQPFHVASRLLARVLYGEDGYGLPPTGDPESVARLTPDDLRQRFRDGHASAPRVLAISGDVPAEAVLEAAARLFAGPAAGRSASGAPVPPGRPLRTREEEIRPVQQAQILVGYFAPPIGHPDHVAVRVMNVALGGGMSSRLFRTLRDAEGLAYSVGSAYPTRRGTGRIVVHLGTAPASAPAAEAGIRREVERIRADGVGEDELLRTKTYMTGAFALDQRTNARRSFSLAFYELMGVGADYGRHLPELIEAVTTDDVRRVAQRYLVDPAVVVVSPA